MCASKVRYGCIFYPPKHNRAPCNSLKNFKTLKGPYSGSRSWSRHHINTCCIVITHYTYSYACRNIFSTIKTSGHSSLEKYTSHFIERVVCERELETELNCNILTPTLMAITALLSRSPGLLNRGPGASSLLRAGSHSSNWNTDFKLWTPTALNFMSPGLYHCFRYTQFNPTTVKAIPWSPDLLRPDAPVIYTGAFLLLTAWPERRLICNWDNEKAKHRRV